MARARRSGRKTDYTWIGKCASFALASGAAAINSITAVGAPFTVMRIRGQVLGSIDGAVDNDKVCVACGIIVATADAVAAGVASLPSPEADTGAEWIWHGYLLMQAQGTSTDQKALAHRLEVDSKAMRKMKALQELVFVVDSLALAGTPATDVTFGVRVLLGD